MQPEVEVMGWCSKPDKASQTAEKKGGDKKVDDPKQPCPQDDANIVSIAWLDGAAGQLH